jgi:uncharacterized protein (DUF1330 family)
MKAYLIAAETVNDQAMFDAYRKEVPATLAPFGGSSVSFEGGASNNSDADLRRENAESHHSAVMPRFKRGI